MKNDSPHVDEVLGERDRVRIAGYGDGPVGDAILAVVAVGDADHGAGYLTDLCDLGAALADDAADQLVRHGHLVRL